MNHITAAVPTPTAAIHAGDCHKIGGDIGLNLLPDVHHLALAAEARHDLHQPLKKHFTRNEQKKQKQQCREEAAREAAGASEQMRQEGSAGGGAGTLLPSSETFDLVPKVLQSGQPSFQEPEPLNEARNAIRQLFRPGRCRSGYGRP